MGEFNLENKASSILSDYVSKVMEAQGKELNSLVIMFFEKNPKADPLRLKIIQQNEHDGVKFSLSYDFENHKQQTATVSDEAVQVMPERIYAVQSSGKSVIGFDTPSLDYKFEYVRADIAALSAAPCSVEVKKLEWFKKANGDIVSDSAFGWFRLHMVVANTCFRLETPDGFIEHRLPYAHWPECEAKAAAQADFDRRILSQIITKPVDVAAVRRQAFEEFAKAITSNDNFGFDDGISADWHPYPEHQIRKNIKDTIRALSPAEPVDQWQDIATCEPVHALFYGTDRHGEKCVMQGYKAINGTIYIDNRDAAPVKITHWMPLPAAPTSKGSE